VESETGFLGGQGGSGVGVAPFREHKGQRDDWARMLLEKKKKKKREQTWQKAPCEKTHIASTGKNIRGGGKEARGLRTIESQGLPQHLLAFTRPVKNEG